MDSTRLLFGLVLVFGLLLSGCGGSSSSPATGEDAPSSPSDNSGNSGNTDNSGDDTGDTDDSDDTKGGDDGQGEPTGSTDKPVVTSTDPADQEESVSTSAAIRVVFDEAIDPITVTLDGVSLTGPSGSVAIDISVNDATIIMKPKAKLEAGASYTATVKSGIASLTGETLEADYSWQFLVEKAMSGVCADFYSSGFALLEGKETTRPASGVAKPGRGMPSTDPVYKTCVTRASNAQSEIGVGWVRNDYSRRQAFNADDSRYLARARFGRWFIHDTQDTSVVRELAISGGYVEPQWHPVNPDLMYVFDESGGLRIRTYNVRTDEYKVVADFRNVNGIAGYPGLTSINQVWSNAGRVWTRWEGSPSADGRYWGLMVQTSSEGALGMITYDMETDTITGVYDYAKDGNGVGQPDHVSMSPSGDYILPSWDSPRCTSKAALGTRSNPCGLMSFSRDFSRAVGLASRSPHSDIGIDVNGRDVIVAADYETGWVEMWDVATGERTSLWYIWENGGGTAMHISAKNFDKPGWVLISTYAEKSQMWYSRKIMAVEMKANPRILNIAHTYNAYSTYWTEPHATVNRDFTKILFNSNWGSGDENVDIYMINLPDSAVPAM